MAVAVNSLLFLFYMKCVTWIILSWHILILLLFISNLVMIYLFSRYNFYINNNIIIDHLLHKE